MSFYDAIRVGASGAAGDFEIERSLRFNDADDTYLQRTVSSTSNRKTFTVSAWIKPSETDSRFFFAVTDTSGFEFFYIGINSFHRLVITDYDYPVQNVGLVTNRLFRDPSAWYHIVVAFDTTQATDTNRVKLYVNGVQETSWYNTAYPAQNLDTFVNHTTFPVYIGKLGWGGGKYHGYMAEYNFVDGLQLTPSSFGETDAITGQWVAKKPSVTYGTNGFRLNFSDNSGTTATTLGKDLSGNGNNFTPNNFSVSAGAGNDSLEDTPTNNFATINGVFRVDGFDGTRTLSEGNLAISGSTNDSSGDFIQAATIPFPLTGKWYVEATVTTLGSSGGNEGGPLIGITDMPFTNINSKSKVIRADGKVATTGNAGGAGNSQFTTSFGGNISQGDIWQLAYDADNRYVYFGKNNSWANGSGSYNQSNFSNAQAHATQPTAGVQQVYIFTAPYSGASMSYKLDFNFGQRAFAHTPPTGYEKLNSANLPDPTILLPNKHFDTLLWSGDGTANRAITGLDFQPDWVWLKSRTNTDYHQRHDSNRGASAGALFHVSAAEDPNYPLDSFDSNGFTTSEAGDQQNTNGYNYVAWNWNAGDAASKTYRVVVVSDSGNKYRFRNSANSATFAQSAVTLDLEEGGTYTFDGSDSTMASHPIKLSTTANGTHGGGSSYNTGVTYELDGSTVTESAYVSGYSSATSRKLIITVAASAPTLYYYCHVHSGMGGQINTNSTLGSSNFDGDLQSVTKVNATAGFSIVKWTSGANLYKTVGHGLGVKPSIVILKARTTSNNWFVYFDVVDGTNDFMELSATNASLDAESYNIVPPTSTVFGTDGAFVSGSTNIPHIAYVFSSVSSYSKVGAYKGNGNANGTFVPLSFRPSWVMLKRADSADHWIIKDSKRNTRNDVFSNLGADIANAEFGTSANVQSVDFLSNGFKLRGTDSGVNANNGTYIYLAFAESPFKNSRAR